METFFCSVLAFLSLASCNFINSVAGNEYQLVSPKYSVNVTLGFNKGSFYGQALNRYFGTYKSADNTVTFSNVGSTKMAGSPEDMLAEGEYFRSFGSSTMEYKIEGDTLILKSQNGTELKYEKVKKEK